MELGLQFGWGMMTHSDVLISRWGGGTLILSPRDLEVEQLPRIAQRIRKIPNSQILLDPQFYLPRSDHDRLTSHDYWPDSYQTGTFWGGPGMDSMLAEILQINENLQTSAFIIPSLLLEGPPSSWIDIVRLLIEESIKLNTTLPLYMTIALSHENVRDMAVIQEVLEEIRDHDIYGVYVLLQPPDGEYLVSDPLWFINSMELVAGLRLLGKDVILGYANHQMICMAATGLRLMASGTWLNVRSFTMSRFDAANGETKRKSNWYYAPKALSEFKKTTLDVAFKGQGLNDLMVPSHFDDDFSGILFQGVQPSSVAGFNETYAFRHYLDCLHQQIDEARQSSFDDTLSKIRNDLDEAEKKLSSLNGNGVLDTSRSFANTFDPIRSALNVLESRRGPTLRRRWSAL